MKTGAKTFTLFLSLVCFFTSYSQENIPIRVIESGHIVIKAKVNNAEGDFIFDTGGGITLLTKKFSEKIKNVKKQDGGYTGFRATGERIDLDLFTVDNIEIGKRITKKPTVTIMDVNLGEYDGIVSLDLFETRPFSIDFKNKLFIFETAESIKKKKTAGLMVPLQLSKDRNITLGIFACFTLNNKMKLQFSLDSGAGDSAYHINSKYLEACDIDISDTSKVKIVKKGSEFNADKKTLAYIATVAKLEAANDPQIKLESFSARFIPDLIYDGKISINWLGEVLTFNLPAAELIITKY